ncbi:MAG: D-alanyl-D-alanine carboxypeptidase [Actinobacteria bacterium]|nr:D-alanyl-D-alanine carboxypeptidase [Actinomycetota bacterium]
MKTRLGWAIPILVLAVVAATLTVLVGPAGGAASTMPTAAATDVFIVRAADLGDFAARPPSLTSPAAIVVNMTTGRVLYSKKADVKRPMASTTKIMTAILCLESLPLDKPVNISEKAAQTPEVKAFLKEGDVLTVEQLLYSMLVHSSNASAVALAEAAAGTSEAFVERMNAKASELGLKNTHFVNPNGLDASGHYSTASDMAKLAIYAMKNAQFRKIVGTRSYTLAIAGRSQPLVFENTNKLMLSADWVTGVKTGLTPRADQCLVASGVKNGVSILSVVLGQPSSSICWDESRALLEYGFSQYRHVTFLDEGVAVAQAEVPFQLDGRIQLITEKKLEMDLYKDDDVMASVRVDRQLTLPVQTGERFGQVILTNNGKTVGAVDLVADESYARTTLGTKISYAWDRFARWLGGVF